MSTRTALAIAVVTLSLLGATSLVTAQKSTKLKDRQVVSQKELRQKQLEKARQEATPIEGGAITRQQIEHSKFYKKYATGKKLLDLTSTVGDVQLRRDIGTQGGDQDDAPFDFQKSLQEMADSADAVIIGVMKSKSSQLTEDEDYVFTDYEIAVNDVLKNNAAASIQTNDKLTVTRPGGTILLNGRVVQAIDESFQPLRKGGEYLLFLRYIPATGGYQALNSRASFQLSDDKVTRLTKEPLALGNEDVASFVSQVRAAVAHSANKKVKGGAK